MLKGKDRNICDKLSSISYLEIPEFSSSTNNLETFKVFSSKKQHREAAMFFAFILIFFIGWVIENDTYTIYTGAFGMFLLSGLTMFILGFFNKNPKFILTSEDLTYKQYVIKWRNITNMYIKKQDTGDDYVYDLIIETKYGGKEEFNLGWLNIEPNEFPSILGKYYWNWRNKNTSNKV